MASNTQRRSSSKGIPPFMVVFILVCGALLLFHLAALANSAISGGVTPTLSDTTSAVISSWKNPAAGYAPATGISWLAYLFFALLLILLVATIFMLSKVFSTSSKKNAGRTRRERTAQAHRTSYEQVKGSMSKAAALESAKVPLRSLLIPPDASPREKKELERKIDELPESALILSLGKTVAEKKELFGLTEDTTLVIAPPRSGKSSRLAAGRILDAPAAFVATSTRHDLFDMTAGVIEEDAQRKVWVFDLDNVSGWHRLARWNPIIGSEDIEVALRRGKAWAGAQPMKGVKGGDWFNKRAGEILGRLFFIAAVAGKDMEDVLEWAHDLESEAIADIVQSYEDVPGMRAVGAWMRSLSSPGQDDGNFAVKQSLSGLLEPLAFPRVMRQMNASADEAFDFIRFVNSKDGLYLIADPAANQGIAPFVSMFAAEVIETARRESVKNPGGRFWPQFTAVLDEAPNLAAFPEMGPLVTTTGGNGIAVVLFAQDPEQIVDRWGQHQATEIMNAANAKYYFPGLGINRYTEELAKLVGDYDLERSSRTRSERGGSSTSYSTDEKQIMTAKDINDLPSGTAMLRYRNLSPIHVSMPAYWEREDGQHVQEMRYRTAVACGRDPRLKDLSIQGAEE